LIRVFLKKMKDNEKQYLCRSGRFYKDCCLTFALRSGSARCFSFNAIKIYSLCTGFSGLYYFNYTSI
jgi:hypothetical protein